MLSLDIEEGGMKMINTENQQKNVPGEMDSKTILNSQFGRK